jgi:peptide methionine sulfoxide reductase MsrB
LGLKYRRAANARKLLACCTQLRFTPRQADAGWPSFISDFAKGMSGDAMDPSTRQSRRKSRTARWDRQPIHPHGRPNVQKRKCGL